MPARIQGLTERDSRVVSWLHKHGASFFAALHDAAGGGFPKDTVEAIWDLVWQGLLTNDTMHALRGYTAPPERARKRGRPGAFRSRRLIPPSAEGRWTLVGVAATDPTKWATAMAQQLLTRHGIVTRDVTAVENLPGGFSAMYPVLRRLEETGRIRRGYFVAGLGAAQFAQAGAIDLLRDARESHDEDITVTISAADPANPYGVLIPWPMQIDVPQTTQTIPPQIPQITQTSKFKGQDTKPRGATRSAGGRVVLVNGRLVCWIGRGDRQLIVSLPDDEPERSRAGNAMARELVALAHRAAEGRRGWLIEEINGQPAADDPASRFLIDAGFAATHNGLQFRIGKGVKPNRPSSPQALEASSPQDSEDA